jgi:crossover junction endodeoxyribonuclease RuvC
LANQAVQRILGIDPGTHRVGYAFLDRMPDKSIDLISCGIITTPKTMTSGERLSVIRQDVLSLIAEFKPQYLAIESIFFFKNAKTVVSVAQARGVLLEAASSSKLECFEYTPMQVKLNLTGYGRADKAQIQDTIARILGHAEIIKPDDAADAVAIAICHARQPGLILASVK